jgi:hypothetical protein
MAIQAIQQASDPERPRGVMGFLDTLGNLYKENKDTETFNNIINEYQQNINEEGAYEKAQLDLMKSPIAPKKRIEMQRELNEAQEGIIKKQKAFNDRINAQAKKKQMSAEEKESAIQLQEKRGMPRHEAEAFVNATPSVQAQINRDHQELVNRGLRKPQGEVVEAPKQVAEEMPESPVDQALKENPESWPALLPPKDMINQERVKWEDKNQTANNKELVKADEKFRAFEGNDRLIKSMKTLNDSNKLPKGISSAIIDPSTGLIRPEAQLAGLANTETQLYAKNLAQFIKGAKEIFGARVTNFDVGTFMNQLPSLLNSDEGRRVILEQMQLVNDLEKSFYKTKKEALQKYSRSGNYADIVGIVDKKVEAKEQETIDRLDNVVKASGMLNIRSKNPEKFKGTALYQDPEGKFWSVKDSDAEKAKNKGWKKW